VALAAEQQQAVPPLDSLIASPTEQRNPRSMDLDRLSIDDAVTLMLEEEAQVAPALLAHRDAIARGVTMVARAFRRGGRLFYAGAGTSGRLGVLDASECPPTFRTPPDMVQAIIAGGTRAIWSAVEGAEDDARAGAEAVAARGAGDRDVVVGIAASGRTPFVWGALGEARRRGAATILLCFNPHVALPRGQRPTLVIAADVGPEVLTGSTRLKAGTATKLVLNALTTLAMVRIGKVRSNLMIDVRASNAKLRARAVRIVQALTGAGEDAARAALDKTQWHVADACARLGAPPRGKRR
jgi:N-acetylmuramic acid 6-phosphate etherase